MAGNADKRRKNNNTHATRRIASTQPLSQPTLSIISAASSTIIGGIEVNKPRNPPGCFNIRPLSLVVFARVRVSLAQHPPIDLEVLPQPLSTLRVSRVFTGHAIGMVSIPSMRHSAGPFNRLATPRCCAQRVIRFMIVISTKRFPIKHIERLVREWFLLSNTKSIARQ